MKAPTFSHISLGEIGKRNCLAPASNSRKTKITHRNALRFIYRDYLQIAAFDLTRTNQPALWFITWDPTQPVATRPLAIRTAGAITQPIQWSSEYHDPETSLIYYNFRYYNPADGRWTRRDPIGIEGGGNLYAYVSGNVISWKDRLGLTSNKIPVPTEPIFLYPYEYDKQGQCGVDIGLPDQNDFLNLYSAVAELANKQSNGRPCYKVMLYMLGPASVEQVENTSCDYKFVIGHGWRKGDDEYVLLKNGSVCLNNLRKNGCQSQGYGCDIGESKGNTSYVAALYLLIKDIKSLASSPECPCEKKVCIFSGPVNQ